MKKLTLILCLTLCGLFVIGGATASAAGKKPMDREKALTGLYNSFLFNKEELGKYFDSGISYMELKKLCLHAYAAKKPLDKKLTTKYMKLGYASHQVKRAIFISRHCDKSVEELLAMKTRQQKWGDICEQLGLPRDACMK